MRYTLSGFIKDDLEAIADWIAQDNPRRAITFVREIRDQFGWIAEHPLQYQLRPDIGDEARIAIVGRYVVLFWIDIDTVRFERVVFGGRDLPAMYH